ncbi:MAG TPA: CPBP family intramembrane glutamic endopeptidase [Myxococcota bacterium]|nr:CPBP family intramembrane glutamic endopeptidase [Myxococcota bacterium]
MAARLVWVATAFYALVLAAALGWRWLADGELPVRANGPALWPVWARVGSGLGLGLALVAASRAWTAHSASARKLSDELAGLVRGLSTARVLLLAAVSGVAEEAFFRGALQPRVGWLAASVLFGLAHFHPRRELRVWAPAAAIAGLGFGALFEASGDLVAPALAHAVVNALNLHWLARGEPGRTRTFSGRRGTGRP